MGPPFLHWQKLLSVQKFKLLVQAGSKLGESPDILDDFSGVEPDQISHQGHCPGQLKQTLNGLGVGLAAAKGNALQVGLEVSFDELENLEELTSRPEEKSSPKLTIKKSFMRHKVRFDNQKWYLQLTYWAIIQNLHISIRMHEKGFLGSL